MARPKKDASAPKASKAPKKDKKPAAYTGKSRGTRKLNDEQVLTIVSRHGRGERQAHLASEYGVTSPTIASIVHGRTYRWLTGIGLPQEAIKQAA